MYNIISMTHTPYQQKDKLKTPLCRMQIPFTKA